MRLGISAEFVRPGVVGGTEQALHNLVDGIDAVAAPDDRITVFGRDNSRSSYTNVGFRDPPRTHNVRFVQESLTLRSVGADFDVCYYPNYFTPPVPTRCRLVTTIPDLQFRHLPENFSRQKRLWQRWAHGSTLRRADVVAVYSEFVRSDILSHHGDRHADKLRVLRIPVSWDRFESAHRSSPDRPYVLSVASHYRHKNLGTLVRAFRAVHAEYPDLELVLVGQLGRNLIGVRHADDIAAVIDDAGLAGVVRSTGYISEHELGELYRNAELFVYPSIFEGFGLPPVEALGFGLPVVTTGMTSIPEATLGLAHYVDDPFDTDELASAMIAELHSPSPPTEEQVRRVREHYDPRAVAGEFLEIARRLV